MTPNNFTPPPADTGPPKGDLEELFRHHLAEAKAPPRALVWEQLDNALLVRQNETYRRRLAATRWVAAASLLLASLAGGDWWARHTPPAPPAGAVAARPAGGPARPSSAPSGPAAPAAPAVADGQRHEFVLRANSTVALYTNGLRNQPKALNELAGLQGTSGTSQLIGTTNAAPGLAFTARSQRSNTGWAIGPGAHQPGAYGPGGLPPGAAAGFYGAGLYPADAGPAYVGATGARPLEAGALAAPADGAAAGGTWAALASRTAALAPASPAGLPSRLAAVAAVPNVAAAPLRRWQFGASYAAGVFQPNVDFSQGGAPAIPATYTLSLAARSNSVTLNNQAAAEYRAHLRGGLDQRLALRATRRLGGRWALSTGLELGQHEAQSATSTSFVGEPLADYNAAVYYAPPTALRTTSFRYRTAGVPVALHYANPVKRGWSAYGRFGAVVSALLNVRSEVAGEPEATKTYSLAANGSPYRRLLATLRGGAGAQYRPAAGRWTLSAGPTAELGVLSLNAQPVQDFTQQHRPYSFGLEATVDFGGTAKMP